MPARPTRLTGCAGEYWVAYRLCRLGFPVALTREGLDVIDLMVGSHVSGRALALQIKTAAAARKPSYWEWPVGRKPLELKNAAIVYAFVDLKDEASQPAEPDVFLVPVADVAAQAIHEGFLDNPDWKTFYFKIRDGDKERYWERWALITEHLTGSDDGKCPRV